MATHYMLSISSPTPELCRSMGPSAARHPSDLHPAPHFPPPLNSFRLSDVLFPLASVSPQVYMLGRGGGGILLSEELCEDILSYHKWGKVCAISTLWIEAGRCC